MPAVKLDIVTAERQIFSDQVTAIIAEGVDGQMTILPNHAPLITVLSPGELVIRKDNEEFSMAVTGGFLEVMPDKVIILADACERSDEINAERAEEAKKRAEERLKSLGPELDRARAEAALRRSLIRLKVVEKRRKSAGFKA